MVAKKDMYLQVKKVIQKHSSSWSDITAFGTAFANFNEKLADLQNLSDGQENATLGVRALKDQKRLQAVESAMELLGAMKALASIHNLPDLKEQLHIHESNLRLASKKDFLHLLNRIFEKANEHLVELASFGIDQAKIDAFSNLHDEVEFAITTPRTAVIDRKTFTLKIDECLSEMDAILKGQLDTLMLVLKKQHPDFYKDYQGARVVIDPKGPSKSKNAEKNTEAYD